MRIVLHSIPGSATPDFAPIFLTAMLDCRAGSNHADTQEHAKNKLRYIAEASEVEPGVSASRWWRNRATDAQIDAAMRRRFGMNLSQHQRNDTLAPAAITHEMTAADDQA